MINQINILVVKHKIKTVIKKNKNIIAIYSLSEDTLEVKTIKHKKPTVNAIKSNNKLNKSN
jgi:hypothetical protein